MKKASQEAIAALDKIRAGLVWIGDKHSIVDDLSLLRQVCFSLEENVTLVLETGLPEPDKKQLAEVMENDRKYVEKCRKENKALPQIDTFWHKFPIETALYFKLTSTPERKEYLGATPKTDDALAPKKKAAADIAECVYKGGGDAVLIGGRRYKVPTGSSVSKLEEVVENSNSLPEPIKTGTAHDRYKKELSEVRRGYYDNIILFTGLLHALSIPDTAFKFTSEQNKKIEVSKDSFGLFKDTDVGIAFAKVVEDYLRTLMQEKRFALIDELNKEFGFYLFPEDPKDSETVPSIVFVRAKNNPANNILALMSKDKKTITRDQVNPLGLKGGGCTIL